MSTRPWKLTLAGGLVVALTVTALLHRLLRAVLEVHDRVDALWTSGKHVAQNTQAGHLLHTTAARAAELAEEAQPRRDEVPRREA